MGWPSSMVLGTNTE